MENEEMLIEIKYAGTGKAVRLCFTKDYFNDHEEPNPLIIKQFTKGLNEVLNNK